MAPPQSDEDLMRALGQGDESALRTLVDRHTPSIYRFSVRFTGDESLAEDICQEVFLRLYRNARRYVSGMRFRTWLFAIVRNTSIDLARPYTYRKAFSLDEHPQAAEQGFLNTAVPDPEAEFLSKESAQKVARAVGALPEKQRTAVILRYYEDMTAKEIAYIMQSTVSSVESLLLRAKHNLIRFLKI